MDIDVEAEVGRLLQEVQSLAIQLQELDKQRQLLANEIVKRQGAVENLRSLSKE